MIHAGSRCGRTTFDLPQGIIASPQYPINYQPGEFCDYEIQTEPGHNLLLKVHDINIPSQDPFCTDLQEDRIQVLKKTNGSNNYTEVTNFCGQTLYPPLTIKGASSALLKFTSNGIEEGRFLLQYTLILPIN